ncbi:hypothetical protein ScPMuIL_004663 [Solemya velum]
MAMKIGHIDQFDSSVEPWDSYVERLEQFFICNDVRDEKKVPVLLTVIGGSTYSLLRGLTAPKKPHEETYANIVQKLKTHLCPKPLVIAERFRFHKREQKPDESVREYIAALHKLSADCEFVQNLNDSLRDRLVCGLRSEQTQKKLLTIDKLTYETATDIAVAMETATRDAIELQSKHAATSSVNKIQSTTSAHKTHSKRKSSYARLKSGKQQNDREQGKVTCFRCKGTSHEPQDCFFKDKECYRCQRRGHAKRACKVIYGLDETSSDESDCGGDCIGTLEVEVNSVGKKHGRIMLAPTVNGVTLNMELDTGAAVSVIPMSIFSDKFPGERLERSDVTLKTYSGEKLKPVGMANVTVEYKGQTQQLKLYVVQQGKSTLFGRDWLMNLRMDWPEIKAVVASDTHTVLQTVLDKHKNVFQDDWGTLKGIRAKLTLKPDSRPKFVKARQVPYVLKPKVEMELDKLVKDGVLTKCDHSDWATPIVPVPKKNGSVRLCGDFKVTLNPMLEIDQYPLPRIEDIFVALSGGKHFSRIDLRHAYLQMEVDDDSRPLLTINTEKGLYRYNRLVYGVASAPAIWQRAMDTILQGLTGVKCIIDDMIITGKTDEEHLQNLDAVLQRLDEHELRVNMDKCEFFKKKVSFCGHEIDREGLHKTQEKIEAVVRAPQPTNVSELRSFLGIVNYYACFLPNLSSTLHPSYQLLEKGRVWNWTAECAAAFENIKKLITSDEVLTHYDPALPLRLATDASPYGLGAVLSHAMPDGNERPVAYASRSLLTDHQPLISIFGPKKGVSTTSAARLQRQALYLSGYDYEIVYKNTKKHGNADSLSRLPLPSTADDPEQEIDEVDILHVAQMEKLPVKSEKIRQETRRDPLMFTVYDSVMRGWSNEPRTKEMEAYFIRRTELVVHQGSLLWGVRVIVPPSLRSRVMEELHQGHIGVVKMKSLARSHVWWPGIDKDIEALAKGCEGCQAVKHSPPAAPIHPWEWPSRPWERIHVDFAGPFLNSMFLVVVDAHSKWPEVVKMKKTTSARTIEVLRTIFARNGIPKQFVSDNGPQFT